MPGDVVQRHRCQQPGIVYGRFDFRAVADYLVVFHQELDVPISHPRHGSGLEVGDPARVVG
jgi:hypothetical protein